MGCPNFGLDVFLIKHVFARSSYSHRIVFHLISFGQAAPPAAPAPKGGAAAEGRSGAGSSTGEYSNWVNSHSPKHLGDLVGNASIVRKLTEWLNSWEDSAETACLTLLV